MIKIPKRLPYIIGITVIFFYSYQTYGFVNDITARYNFQSNQIDSIFFNQIDSLRNRFNQNNFEYAKDLQKALSIYESVKGLNNIKLKFQSLILVGDIYERTNNYKEALRYFKEAHTYLNYFKSDLINPLNEFDLATGNLRLGYAYFQNKMLDSAKLYYKKVDLIKSLSRDVLYLKAVSYNNLSGLYQRDSLFVKAEEYSKKAIAIYRRTGNRVSLSNAYNNLGSLYLSQGSFKQAKQTYEEGISIISNDNSEIAIRAKADLYYNLAWAMRNLKEYKAYDALEDSYDLSDKIRDINLRQVIEEVKQKHNVDLVKKQAEIDAAEASKESWIYILISISVIFLLSSFLVSYNLRQRNLSLKLARQESEQEKKLSEIKAESQALILNAALDGKESERKEIAETLHDNVSTLLSSANLHLQACKTQFNGNTPVEVDKTQIIINEASQKIRDLSHTLVSSILLKFGLSFALSDMAKKYSNSQIEISGDIESLGRFNQKFEIKVYNIIQELVNNILKHSEATKASIILAQKQEHLFIQINDNGKGFDKTKISVKDGLGINQIDARIQMMKGKFEIDSKFKRGTSIQIELPISYKDETKIA